MIWQNILAVLLLAASFAHAQPYRWIDDKGRVQIGNTPPANAKAVRKIDLPAEPVEGRQPLPYEVQQAQKDFPVTLYTAPTCKQPCELARAALNRRGVPFTEVQVWNAETLAQLKSRVGSSDKVPAIVVGRTPLSGFDQAAYDGLLDSARYPKEGAIAARSQPAPAPPDGYKSPPVAEPVRTETDASVKPGLYDTSGLPSNRSDKPGPYDPSGLKSNRIEKSGPYVAPGGAK